MKKIAVIFGGASKDYATSVRSACNLVKHLLNQSINVIPIGITRSARWLFCPPATLLKMAKYSENRTLECEKKRISSETPLLSDWEIDSDCFSLVISPDPNHGGIIEILDGNEVFFSSVSLVISVLHGRYGDCGRIQSLLALSGLNYSGSNPRSASIASDLSVLYPLLSLSKINLFDHLFINTSDFEECEISRNKLLDKIIDTLKFPLKVQATVQTNAVGANYPNNREELIEALKTAFAHHKTAICESLPYGYDKDFSNTSNVGSIYEAIIYDLNNIKIGQKIKKGLHYKFKEIDSENITNKIKKFCLDISKITDCHSPFLIRLFVDNNSEKIFFRQITVIPGIAETSVFSAFLNNSNEIAEYFIN
jgi:D-alanine--D-alanine ligase